MPRLGSFVMTLSSSLPIVLTQTCSTFFGLGAIQASRAPSGESFGLNFSGLPNRTSRGIKGGNSAWLDMGAPRRAAKEARTKPRPRVRVRERIEFRTLIIGGLQ